MTFLNKQGVVKIVYLGGITMALMGLVLLLIFGLLIGRPYFNERNLQEYLCRTFNVTDRGRHIACNTTEKSRDSKFPCFTVMAALAYQIEMKNGSQISARLGSMHSLHEAFHLKLNEGVKLVTLYDNFVTYEKFTQNDLHCSTFPCHVPPLQNQREAEQFARNYGTGKTYRCYFSGTFDEGAAILNKTVEELPVLQLLAWPAGAFILGLFLIFVIYVSVGCSVWEDAVMV